MNYNSVDALEGKLNTLQKAEFICQDLIAASTKLRACSNFRSIFELLMNDLD